ncbi:BatA domain-containing protein [Lignipirellula cremea]|uniref:Aerotolerance regulator N-terminal domain-containing protein n=1 Tax=Lignipirellula cremea TaxID=2528010 RepID=A0A518E274_9BACT|nr:BatA domain-containing protein [Lignipirellula cremea]QDU98181.1 hypothetical protein Pla8534_60420 [Lignipirellula cremea]
MGSLLTLLNGFFANGAFFLAGLGAAAVPTIIHLLNRRRYRTLPWAAMNFLRQAMQRNRKIMDLRDLILLMLRTFAILLFGLALARPIMTPASLYFWGVAFPALLGLVFFAVTAAVLWSRPAVRWGSLAAVLLLGLLCGWGVYQQTQTDPQLAQQFDGSQPLHAVLLIDNSLSMSYETALEGTLLQRAAVEAESYIKALPNGSRVSVVPLCGPASTLSIDPYTQDDAVAAVQRIEVVDRSVSLTAGLAAAEQAVEAAPLMARRIVLIGDQQSRNWLDIGASDLERLGGLQVVDVSPEDWENSWISDFYASDGLADVETPANFVVQVRHNGPSPRRDVQVTLQVDGVDIASRTVTLQPGEGAREVAFSHVFHSYRPEPGQPSLAPVTARLTPDNLPGDDQRHLILPVVAAVPVVFVDQYGAQGEDEAKGQIGETRPLRRLLAPGIEGERRLVEVRHVTIDQLNRDVLADARLVIVAGVASPAGAVDLLREYVEQGGPLIIAAGGEFDSAAWSNLAWRNGDGILPAPLSSTPIGLLPEEAGLDLQPFYLKYDSLSGHPYFQLPDISEEDLRDLFAEPFFFKAAAVDLSDAVIADQRAHYEAKLRDKLAAQGDAPDDSEPLRWLLWESQAAAAGPVEEADLARLVEQSNARVLARFATENEDPFIVQRRIGQGEVLFVASGVQSNWNTLPVTNTVLIFDRIARSLIRTTLPRRTLPPQERFALALPPQRSQVGVLLQRPSEESPSEPLDVGFIGQDRRGVQVAEAFQRGVYRLYESEVGADGAELAGEPRLWELFAVNGDAEESELTPLTSDQFASRELGEGAMWVGRGREISLAGEQQYAQNLWWWLALAVLVLLLAEIVLLATSAWPTRPAANPAEASAAPTSA